jgi:ADP-ribose pyrophosphatase YjhB (NUDIX family)
MTFIKKRAIQPKAACALIIQNGKVLSVSRKNDPNAFGLAGGGVEPGEDPLAAALRELREETGLNAGPKDAIPIYTGPCQDKSGKDIWVVTYLITAWQGTPRRPPGEGVVAWKDWEDIILGPFGDYNVRLKRAYDDFAKAYLAVRKIG